MTLIEKGLRCDGNAGYRRKLLLHLEALAINGSIFTSLTKLLPAHVKIR
jgi:hypothetical protein